jgi:methylated-DNA-[protein]-cysteine S-methyltransferase
MTTTTNRTTNTTTDTATLCRTVMDSPLGPLTLVASDRGLRAVMWPDERLEDEAVDDPSLDEPSEARQIDDAIGGELVDEPSHPVLVTAVSQLEEYFAGRRTEFDLPLDLVGTNFQLACWISLADIPYGETRTYGEQALSVGRPTATRAVGAANGRNPVSIVLPCHRVIGADGSLTGFGGGLGAKRWLLDHERSRVEPGLPFD